MKSSIQTIVTVIILVIFGCVYFKIIQKVYTYSSCKNVLAIHCQRITHDIEEKNVSLWEQEFDFYGFDNETGTVDGRYLVPNYVQFIHFNRSKFNFPHALSILSALKNQRPEKLFIHTDQEIFSGKYWNVMMNVNGFKEIIVIQKIEVPTEIFGNLLQPRWKYFHGGDVARIEILMEFGGIYLDTDCYVVRSLDDFRRFEMTLSWQPGRYIGNQILVAHKSARFLRLWHNSYRYNYNNASWSYNSDRYPGHHILNSQPELVHRVDKLLGANEAQLLLYLTEFPEWREYYTFHLASRHVWLRRSQGPVKFDEKSAPNLTVAIRELSLAVYPFPKISKKYNKSNKVSVSYLLRLFFSLNLRIF